MVSVRNAPLKGSPLTKDEDEKTKSTSETKVDANPTKSMQYESVLKGIASGELLPLPRDISILGQFWVDWCFEACPDDERRDLAHVSLRQSSTFPARADESRLEYYDDDSIQFEYDLVVLPSKMCRDSRVSNEGPHDDIRYIEGPVPFHAPYHDTIIVAGKILLSLFQDDIFQLSTFTNLSIDVITSMNMVLQTYRAWMKASPPPPWMSSICDEGCDKNDAPSPLPTPTSSDSRSEKEGVAPSDGLVITMGALAMDETSLSEAETDTSTSSGCLEGRVAFTIESVNNGVATLKESKESRRARKARKRSRRRGAKGRSADVHHTSLSAT
ncbi:uncharacterized protein BXZ73DRAFT_75268 [Epithele typhae]|uniref:uncharacterized protein n=1 Tax=Epithele typhae TaxID=378194 RepID=UPI0020082156|nr:uncharacterized protein BXZ73DRAFT_75268 [Epithele typhae]KAH9941323.1 hypothetical protein BXZ73DRAFT_75268 [Epithele typhae]